MNPINLAVTGWLVPVMAFVSIGQNRANVCGCSIRGHAFLCHGALATRAAKEEVGTGRVTERRSADARDRHTFFHCAESTCWLAKGG